MRSNNFNFLRLLFASMVIYAHSFALVDGNAARDFLHPFTANVGVGGLAVDFFFILSGYLIVKSWVQEPQPWVFLTKRVLRIYPAFIVCSIISALIVGRIVATSPSSYFSDFDYAVFLLDLLLLITPETPDVLPMLSYEVRSVNGSMWSIYLEFMCYLIVLGLGIKKIASQAKRTWWVAIGMLLAAGYMLGTYKLGIDVYGHFKSFDYGLYRLGMCFFAGGAYYLYRDLIKFEFKYFVVSVLGFVAATFVDHGFEIGVALFGGYMLFYIGFAQIKLLQVFNKIPDGSYGLYLYGWPVQILLVWYFRDVQPMVLFPSALLLALLCGILSWELVEKPALALKKRMPARALAAT